MNAGLDTVPDCTVASGFRCIRVAASEEDVRPWVNLVDLDTLVNLAGLKSWMIVQTNGKMLLSTHLPACSLPDRADRSGSALLVSYKRIATVKCLLDLIAMK